MSDDSSFGFVDLDRSFHELSDYARESDDVDVSQAFRRGPSITWSDLRMERRVVLLAEAGAGKTEEIRHAATRWRDRGDHAFFLRLEHVADDLEAAFEVGDLDDFERWKNSQDEAWVLLDSVDEARLRGPSDFERAIRKFATKVRGAEDRLHLLITSRISAWRPKTDLEFCERLLPPPAAGRVAGVAQTDDVGSSSPPDIATAPDKEGERPRFRIVTIDDLDSARIAKFALVRGITNLDPFLAAVERKDAWAYTRRPQDLVELIEFWLTHGRIGSRLELVKSSVARRLEERDQTRAEWQPLAADRVHAAAALIAAACILAHEATIQVPDGSASGHGLRLETVLPDWNARELGALLARPLFDEAIYGAVRFHHREAREYLAAEWFGSLLRRETSRTKIEALFFRSQYDLDVITPALRPVLPWLALLDDRIRDRLLRVAPEVLFEGGDPSQLPKPIRERILRACCEGLAATSTPRTFADYAKRKDEKRRLEEVRNRQAWRDGLQRNVERIRDPGFTDPSAVSQDQWYLLNHLRKDEDRSGRWTDGNWETLMEEFGTAVAEAFRDGAKGFWRRYDPRPRSDGGTPNSTPAAHIFGLAGLAIEARDSEAWAKELSQDEAKRATRYAVGELNGFPPWLPGLFTAHPDAVLSVIMGEIDHQARTEKPDEPFRYVLDDVAWSGMWCWDALGPLVVSLLSTVAPRRADSLQKLLIIVHGSTVSDQVIADLAARGIDECASMECRAVWFASLIGADPEQGIPKLRAYLGGLNDPADRTHFAMHAVTHLVGGRRDGGIKPRQNFISAQHLGDLYALMHEHIRRREDIDRIGGGVYSPELRDDAQDAREGLLGLLDRIPGKATFLALSRLADAHPEESLRPYLMQRARRRAEADGDLSPWKAAQVREFAESLERTPRDHRELADLVLLRFLDLKAELEGGDESLAPVLLRITEETEMRNFLARELRSRARGRYDVPQESELADGKRPDLRFHGNGFDAPVPAELKLADRWTGPKLLERLENQLCGDYLRDPRSRRGLFVLVHNGTEKAWTVADGSRVDFDGLVEALTARWRLMAPSFPEVDDVQVVGINLPLRARPSSNGALATGPKSRKGGTNGSVQK